MGKILKRQFFIWLLTKLYLNVSDSTRLFKDCQPHGTGVISTRAILTIEPGKTYTERVFGHSILNPGHVLYDLRGDLPASWMKPKRTPLSATFFLPPMGGHHMTETRSLLWNIPVADGYDAFVAEIRRRVAARVMSRTRGSDGQPIRREIELTRGNESLMETWRIIQAYRPALRSATVQARFHSSGGRVERITFSAGHLRPPPFRRDRVDPEVALERPSPQPTRPRRPPTERPPRETPRPDRGWEQEDEYFGVPSIFDYGRYFRGMHNTHRNTICWGTYDNDTDICSPGFETRNERSIFLHWDRGYRDYRNEMLHGRREISRIRYRLGARPDARETDRVYRQGVLDARREHLAALGIRNPGPAQLAPSL